MRTILPACLLIASLAVPQAAVALPIDERSLNIQLAICQDATQMIVDGATDAQEEAFFERKLRENGWTKPDDYSELMLRCIFFKQGYMFGANYE